MGANSHFAVELLGATADKLAITGNFDLTALDNFLDVTGVGTGSSWVIATYTGTLTGVFESITSGYSVNYGTGTNSLVTLNAGLAGDYNGNGKVDAADYVLWQESDRVRGQSGGLQRVASELRQSARSGIEHRWFSRGARASQRHAGRLRDDGRDWRDAPPCAWPQTTDVGPLRKVFEPAVWKSVYCRDEALRPA